MPEEPLLRLLVALSTAVRWGWHLFAAAHILAGAAALIAWLLRAPRRATA